jgi:leader peptidase (prepilin peptidase)/N-methyltransferase
VSSSFEVELTSWSVRVGAIIFGAVWGSFFNVAIYRWPRAMSVVLPASHCPSCGKPIAPHHNIPVVSYLLLRGKTACCGAKISPRYLLVELIGALLCVAIAERFVLAAPLTDSLVENIFVALCYFAFGGGLVIATFIDLEFMEIPDEISLPITALGLVTASFRGDPGVASSALGAGAGYLIVQVLFVWIYERLTGRRGMGEGDSKLLMAIGAFIGWRGGLFCLLAGAAQGLLVAIPALLFYKSPSLMASDGPSGKTEQPSDAEAAETQSRGAPEQTPANEITEPPPRYVGHLKIPFGPFLAIGAIEYLFFGEQILSVYFAFGEKLSRVLGGMF